MKGGQRGALLVAAAALLWSAGGLAIKLVPHPPLVIVFHRAWIATLTLAVLLRPGRVRPTPTLACAVAAYAGMIISFVVATRWTTAANAIFLQNSGIVWVLLFSPLVARDPIHRRDVFTVIACLAGMALFFAGRISTRGQAGNLVGLLSGVFYAATILLLRRQGGAASEATAILGNLAAALCVAPWLVHPFRLEAASWAILAFLGVIQIGVAYALFVRGLRRVSATEASIVALLEPVLNPLWVFLGIHERPAPLAIVGAAVVLSGILWRTLATGRSPGGAIPAPD